MKPCVESREGRERGREEDRRFVTVALRGGLGNQLFQYAMGRAVACAHGRTLMLDDVPLHLNRPGLTKREYGLGAFDGLKATLARMAPLGTPAVQLRLVEDRRGFHGHLLHPSPLDHIYLAGFWQSPRYFASIEDALRLELQFRRDLDAASSWAARIAEAPVPIALHVRRTDYVTGEVGRTRFGFAGRAYYRRAIALLRERVGSPHFFVFSDDVDWCVRHLHLDAPHSFVRSPAQAPDRAAATDMMLMARCRHFIIANSSFSWWGAWLGGHPDKVVIAPKAWFRDVPTDSAGVTPETWLRV